MLLLPGLRNFQILLSTVFGIFPFAPECHTAQAAYQKSVFLNPLNRMLNIIMTGLISTVLFQCTECTNAS